MNERKEKSPTLKEILLSPQIDYQGNLRYLVPLFYILIVQLAFWILYSVKLHMSRQMFYYSACMLVLIWFLWGLAIIKHKRREVH